MIFTAWLLAFVAVAASAAGGHAIDAEGCDALDGEPIHANVDFYQDIQPLLDVRCAPCHTDGSFGGMNLRAENIRSNLLGADETGAPSSYPGFLRVKPGDAFASLVFLRLNCINAGSVDNPIPRMPPPNGTSTDLQALVHDWITLGAILRSDDPQLRTDRMFFGTFDPIR